MTDKKEKILIYQLGSIGDTIVSIPSIMAIRRHYGPEAEITLLHETRHHEISTPADLLRGSVKIDKYLSYKLFPNSVLRLFSYLLLLIRLRIEAFNEVVYLMPSERTAQQVARDKLFFRLGGIRKLIGFRAYDHEVIYPVGTNGAPGQVRPEVWCRLERLRQDGLDVSCESDLSRTFFKVPADELAMTRKWLSTNRPRSNRTLVAICPGSKQPTNIWPEERFLEIGRRLLATDRYDLVVVGGPAEAAVGDRLVRSWGKGLNAAGKFPVLASAAILSQVAFCLGLDTGTTHLAAALGTPCVALYGGRDNQGRFEPLGKGHIILRHEVSCAPCRLIETPCPVPDHPCLNEISVQMVWEAILKMEASLPK